MLLNCVWTTFMPGVHPVRTPALYRIGLSTSMPSIAMNPPTTAQNGNTMPRMIRPASKTRFSGVAGMKSARLNIGVRSSQGIGMISIGRWRNEPVIAGTPT